MRRLVRISLRRSGSDQTSRDSYGAVKLPKLDSVVRTGGCDDRAMGMEAYAVDGSARAATALGHLANASNSPDVLIKSMNALMRMNIP